jgi:hypothetical protein
VLNPRPIRIPNFMASIMAWKISGVHLTEICRGVLLRKETTSLYAVGFLRADHVVAWYTDYRAIIE